MKQCPNCGNKYKNIGSHWRQSSCEYKELSTVEEDIIIGLLMGDGSLDKCNKSPRLEVSMISKKYLNYLHKKFGILSAGVKFKQSASKSAKENRDRGFSSNAKEENYSDLYRWRTITHPELEKFNDWYTESGKVWPEDIKLTPTVLKHWYCGDGCYKNNNYDKFIQISMSNEYKNTEKVDKYFENSSLPKPNKYETWERKDGSIKCDAKFTVEDSKKLWKYMGDPLPDFEYKWPS